MKKLLFLLPLLLGLAGPVLADTTFAEHLVVLQVSEVNAQPKVLNVANNLLKHYGQDKIDIQVVAFGPGGQLLLNKSKLSKRVSGLAERGVTFALCTNTLKKMTKKAGHAPKLNPHAITPSPGVVRILDLVSKGYVLVKP